MTGLVFEVKNKLAGIYHFAKGKVDEFGAEIIGTYQQLGSTKNLITNGGMNHIYNTTSIGTLSTREMFPYCFVGTGNTTPAFTDSTLVAFLAQNNSTTSASLTYVSDSDGDYWRYLRTYRFNAGTATGNIAEVGTGRRNDLLFSRALILDSGGLPTTITVLADEYLDVTYEFRNYLDLTDKSAVATISGVAYTVDYRPSNIGTAPQIFYPIAGQPSGAGLVRVYSTNTLGTTGGVPTPGSPSEADLGPIVGSYIADSYYVDFTGNFGLTAGNFVGGIGAIEMESSQCHYQFKFTPKIPKDATKVMSITFRISWARF